VLYVVQHLEGRLVRGEPSKKFFLPEPLIGILVVQIVILQSQLLPVEWTQYSQKVAGFLRK